MDELPPIRTLAEERALSRKRREADVTDALRRIRFDEKPFGSFKCGKNDANRYEE